MRFLSIIMLSAASLFAAADLTPAQAEEIIQKFTANESEFAKARESYTYRQTARIQALDNAGNVVGRWEEVADIVFDKGGKRGERVVRAPVSTLGNYIGLTPEDLKDIRSTQPFVLTSANLPDYFVRYLGPETLDEIECYAFAVKPKKLVPGERYFSGIVWVDTRDVQVVKTYGRGVGIAKNQAFPKFETFRQQIDGRYWFPVYTIAEDTLHFESGQDQRIRQIVRYDDYKQFRSSTTITFGDVLEDTPEPPKPPATPAKP